MVALRLPPLLLALLLLLPWSAQARLTLGWVKGAAILGSEDQARRLAAYLEGRLAEPVALRACADEAQLHEWLHRYRMVDLAPLSQDYLRRLPAGQLLPVADLRTDSAAGQLVLRQGLRGDQQLQLRTLLAALPEEPAGRELLASLGGLQLSPPLGAPRASFADAPAQAPAPPLRPLPPGPVWPDELAAARPFAAGEEPAALTRPEIAAPVATALPPPAPAPPVIPAPPASPGPAAPSEAASAAPLPATTAEPAPAVAAEPAPVSAEPSAPAAPAPPALPAPPAAAVEPAPPAAASEPVDLSAAAAPLTAPPTPAPAARQTAPPSGPPETAQPAPAAGPEATSDGAAIPAPAPRLAALPPQPAPGLSEQTVSRSLSSGRQPGEAQGLQTVYLVPFTTIMVPPAVAEAVFDRFVENLDDNGAAAGYEFVILKDDLDRVDPAWLRKATYVTGEIFGYVEESGCCSTDIRSKSRLALFRPGSGEPKLRHEYPAQSFFDHDYSTLAAERQKLAERISRDLSSQLLKALGGG